jgi:hypothetical protein
MADYAGWRKGSWEAHNGGNALIASGYQEKILVGQADKLHRKEGSADEVLSFAVFKKQFKILVEVVCLSCINS